MIFCSGMTLDRVLLNVGPREFANGLTYTGASRVRTMDNLAFDPLPDFQRIISIFGTNTFAQMRQEICRREAQAAERQAREDLETEAGQRGDLQVSSTSC